MNEKMKIIEKIYWKMIINTLLKVGWKALIHNIKTHLVVDDAKK